MDNLPGIPMILNGVLLSICLETIRQCGSCHVKMPNSAWTAPLCTAENHIGMGQKLPQWPSAEMNRTVKRSSEWCMPWHKPNSCNSEHDLDRAFWCSPSCIALLCPKHRALDPVFWCSPSWTNSWFLLLSLVPKNRARGKTPKNTIFGTMGSTKKHDFVHEGEHQKARSRV